MYIYPKGYQSTTVSDDDSSSTARTVATSFGSPSATDTTATTSTYASIALSKFDHDQLVMHLFYIALAIHV